MSELRITHVPEQNRYEARADNELLGVLAYETRRDAVVLTHTEVEPAAEGRGVGSALARTALDNARGRGLRVVPQCPFVAAWIERHPEYADLVVGE